MDFNQLITLLDSLSGLGALFTGIGDTLTGSGNMMTGSGDMAEGTAKLVTALGKFFVQDLISGSLEGTGSTGLSGSATGSMLGSGDLGSAILGSTGS